jgi:hypothetical protein
MALGSARFGALNEAMKLIDEFREASGPGVNISKTTLLHTSGTPKGYES